MNSQAVSSRYRTQYSGTRPSMVQNINLPVKYMWKDDIYKFTRRKTYFEAEEVSDLRVNRNGSLPQSP